MATELKSYTIVPDSLYVERRADKQLHSIVQAMQRPGYVLVSRQMGKTNLLLRAKRKWENLDDLYVYIDMSNIDETEKRCFESLIDTAIDTHEEILGSIREQICDLRRKNILKSPVQAHNEELRVLLNAVNGKLVFILDEIDSLTRTPFSDNIFSQIRSTYFSRVNYPVLEKLTYILSGVVEPTEIIKNPKISPFNIGEKIHLDDFTDEEYHCFIDKAELSWLGEDVIDRIYYWAGGNPRITWDICYELQNRSEQTLEGVDALVKDLYLTSYDKAPIDTIRSLVKEDRDLRDAVIQLAYNKGSSLSDKIKSKLYLAGIVNYRDNDVRIKNRIIKESLSLNWIQKIEEEEKGLLAYAIELHTKGFYQESADRFEAYIKNNAFPDEGVPFYYYYFGSCYYHLGKYQRSLELMTTHMIDPEPPSPEYRREQFICGVDCIKLNHLPEALGYFDNVMKCGEEDSLYYPAKLNSLSARLKIEVGNDDKIKEIEEEYKGILSQSDEAVSLDVKLYASYQIASLYASQGNISEAVNYYDLALTYARDAEKLRILVDKYYVTPENQRPEVLDSIVSSVETLTSIVGTLDPEKNLETDEATFIKVLNLIYYNAYNRWPDVQNKIPLLHESYGDVLFKVFFLSVLTQELWVEGAVRLIKELHDNVYSSDYSLSSIAVLYVFEYNAFLRYEKKHAKEYFEELRASNNNIDSIGLTIVRSYALSLLKDNCIDSLAKELEWIVERYPAQFSHQDAFSRAVFEYALLVSYFSTKDGKSAGEIANLILSYVDDEIAQSNEKNKEILLQIKDSAIRAITMIHPHEPIKTQKEIGRNDRVRVRYVKTNQIVEKKYKHVADDLASGRCEIVVE